VWKHVEPLLLPKRCGFFFCIGFFSFHSFLFIGFSLFSENHCRTRKSVEELNSARTPVQTALINSSDTSAEISLAVAKRVRVFQ